MNKVCKSMLGVSAAAVMLAGVLTPVFVNAWGDNSGKDGRPEYTLDQINNGVLGEKITFNSISNGKIGNEKNFVGAKLASSSKDEWIANTIEVKDGETYKIRLYVHNNSPRGKQAIAKNVTASFSLPSNAATSHTIVGYLDSSNATPTRYWDEVTLKSNDNFYLEYVLGSAKYDNNKGTFSLPDEVITSGAKVGFESMNGELPGCYEYAGVVTIDVKVHSAWAAKISKEVRLKGTEEWKESVEAKVGDEVEYLIEFQNYLNETVNNVMIRDILPNNVEYVQDSTILYNSNHSDGIKMNENTLTTVGVNIGDYKPKSNAYIKFTGKVVDKTLACGDNQLVNWASVSMKENIVYKDDASVKVNKSCDNPTPTPTPTPTPDNPGSSETPTTIVNTGAGTVVTGAIGAGSVVTTLGYYLASRKKLM